MPKNNCATPEPGKTTLEIPANCHPCPHCGAPVSNERSELLGIDECIACTPQKRPPIGVWDYPEGFHERNEGVGGLVILD